MKQFDIYKFTTTKKTDWDQYSHKQLTQLPIRSTERPIITSQQAILLTMISCIENWYHYLLWITLLYIIGIKDQEPYLRDSRMKWMKKREQEQKSDRKYLEKLRQTSLFRFCTKVLFNFVYSSAPTNHRRVSKEPSPNIYVIPEIPE